MLKQIKKKSRKTDFFDTKLTLIKYKSLFIMAMIFCVIDLKCYSYIKIDTLSYDFYTIFSQLIFDDFGL